MKFTGHCVGWLRQSSDTQHSLGAQKAAFDDFVAYHEFDRVTVFSHVASATEDDPAIFLADASNEYNEFKQLLMDGAVDVVWAHDKTRLGRAKWLINHMIEFAINHGAVVYTPGMGAIDRNNFDAMVAISSIGSTADISRLHGERANATYIDKIRRGIPARRIQWTHEYVYQDGDIIGVQLNPAARVFFDDITPDLLDGMPFYQLGELTIAEYPYVPLTVPHNFRRLVWSYMAHGHLMWQRGTHRREQLYHIEAGHPLPDGVVMAYGVIDSVWDDDTHPLVIEDLKRREKQFGRYVGNRIKNPFNRVFYCRACGHPLGYARVKSKYEYVRCRQGCKTNIPIEHLQAWFTAQIEYALDHGILELSLPEENTLEQWQGQVDDLQRRVDQQQGVLNELILQSARHPELQSIYSAQIKQQSDILMTLNAQLKTAQAKKPIQKSKPDEVLNDIRQITIDGLWQLPPLKTSRILRALIGGIKLYVDHNGAVYFEALA